ncbi:MAG: energy transducer TonB [Gammaproteobacteria bacterium]|nr:energy transducer TonB [Gammaproteobacteria bacterium]
MALAPRTGLPPAFLLSLGIHLVVIFGFLLSPAGDSAREVANRAVTVLLAPAAEAPEAAQAEATANQLGSLYQTAPMTPPHQDAQPPERTGSVTASVMPSGLTMSAAASPRQTPTAARAALDADYLLQWQADIERYGNAYYRGLALRHGDGDVRLKVSVHSDGSLRQIDLLESSGSAALDRAAVDTVEKLAPFAPFPQALARETQQLDIIRTWQFRR